MIRIYLDTNVFSNLESNTDVVYQKLNEALKLYKHNLSFYFSPAHIRDKRKADQRKIDYFKFMETLVGDNYISYHALEKKTSIYLATPMMVYNDDDPSFEQSNILDDDENEFLVPLKVLLKNTPALFDISKLNELPDESKELFSKMFPLGKEDVSMYDLVDRLISFSQEMTNDSNVYKGLRGFIFDNFNGGKYDVRNEADFNEALKNSQFQKTFVDYVKDTIYTKYEGRILYYDFYIHSYDTLDILGISKDKIKPKNGFNNILNDAQHSYYARYCDYLVTEDKGLTEKSKALYNLYKVDTKVLSVKEFLEILPGIGADTEGSAEHFVEKFSNDVVDGHKQEACDLSDGSVAWTIVLSQLYLNFFDHMIQRVMATGEVYFTLGRTDEHNYLSPSFREQEAVVNKCINFFGPDINQIGLFDFEIERKEIINDNWKGRLWQFGDILFNLYRNSDSDKLYFQIGPFKTTKAEHTIAPPS